jgi:hypothetical protein
MYGEHIILMLKHHVLPAAVVPAAGQAALDCDNVDAEHALRPGQRHGTCICL